MQHKGGGEGRFLLPPSPSSFRGLTLELRCKIHGMLPLYPVCAYFLSF
jgi:hypothetical protein